MKYNKFLFAFGLLILIAGCRKDDFSKTSTDPLIPQPDVEVQASVRGIVTDEDGNPMSDVLVTNENDIKYTDEEGYFKYPNEYLVPGGTKMSFEKEGYFIGYKFTNPNPGNVTFLKIILIEKTKTGDFPSSAGGTISTTDGAQIIFPANGIKDANGEPYNGNVNVYAHWYNPEDKDISKSMPGDLRAISNEDEIVQLATFGMMAVELRSDSGEELNLNDNSTATLEFPLGAATRANAPDEIPLWSFDEGTGYWKEEGTASLEGSSYFGKVSHFSFWNCDAPFPVVKIKGRIVDEQGNPIPWAEVCISVTTSGLTGYGWTDANGVFCGKVPKDKTLAIKVKDECGNVIYEEVPLGPFGSETDLGDLTVSSNDYGNRIIGRLLDCDNNPVTNGYVILNFANGNYTILDINAEGEFEGYVLNCESQSFTIQGVNLDNLTKTEELSITTVSGQNVSVGDLMACDELEEYIKYTFKENGVDLPETILVNINFTVNLIDNQLQINAFNNTSQGSFQMQVNDVTGPGIYPVNNVIVFDQSPVDFKYVACGDNFGNPVTQPCNGTVEITQIDQEGDFVIGTFNLTEIIDAENLITYDFCGEFKLYMDRIAKSGSVCGVVWEEDSPSDGIREVNEKLLGGVSLTMEALNGNIFTAITDDNGFYEFINIPEGPYFISLNTFGYMVADLNVGSDATIDNDFIFSQDSLGGIVTNFLDIIGGEKLADIDAGLIPQGGSDLDCFLNGPQTICSGETVTVQLSITGGSPPYEVTWNTGATGELIDILDPGNYQATVTDSNNNFCVSELYIDISPTDFINFNVTDELCGNGDGSINIWSGSNWPVQIFLDGVYLGDGDAVVSGLTSGNYNIEVIDEFGCSQVYSIFVGSRNASIGDFVWLDDPAGIPNVFDQADRGLGNVKIRLYEESNPDPIDSTFSLEGGIDSSGWYFFVIENDGNYSIEVELPDNNYEFVEQSTFPEEDNDNDIDPMTGRSWEVEIKDCNAIRTLDVGIKEK